MNRPFPDLPPQFSQTERLPFDRALARAQELVEAALSGLFQGAAPRDLTDAMQYAIVGGKALRAFLVVESARLFGVSPAKAAPAALAIECMHAYSLIHDDLPCMDDDDLRRGKPTVHKRWNEHTAVLAGDALQALAFDLLARPELGAADVGLALVRRMAVAAGADGMVGGQMLDIAAETQSAPTTLDQIIDIQRGKTGALITWSCQAGAVIARSETDALATYGNALGLAFQIADDILDVEGDAETVGKATGKDADAGKATFVSHLGLDGAKGRAQDLVDQACDALSIYGDEAETLRDAARFVIARKH